MQNIKLIREDFPALSRNINGKPLIYFDNAATTLKPKSVVAAMDDYYLNGAANIHRGVHRLSIEATDKYENVRKICQKFINARSEQEIIFTSGTTLGLNSLALSLAVQKLSHGDEVIVSAMEHHANIVPWQLLRERKGIVLKVLPMNDKGELETQHLEALISPRTKVLSCVMTSNSLGTINPVKHITAVAHAHGLEVIIDAAQAVAHGSIDVQDIDCDYLVFSGHKVYGPTGVGVIYGKEEKLKALPPALGGGDMIFSVTWEKTIFADGPVRFEAGTPPIAEVIGLGAALEYFMALGSENVERYESTLLKRAQAAVKRIGGLRIIGEAKEKVGILSFVIDGVHPHDIGTLLDGAGIAVRTGHHCTQPVMAFFGIPATTRASFSFYNTPEEVDFFVEKLTEIQKFFST